MQPKVASSSSLKKQNKSSKSGARCVKRKEKKTFPPWSELPEDILIIIFQSLGPNPADSITFGGVCASWRSVTKSVTKPARHLPWLMLAEDKQKTKFRRFFSPSEDKIHKLFLPEACQKMCCTSFGGWLVTVSNDLDIHLLNPFNRNRIPLPSVEDFNAGIFQGNNWPREQKRDIFVGKVCLSSSPLRGKYCAVLAFYGSGKKLGFARIGDPRWTSISCDWWPYRDAVFHKGKFYAVNHRGDAVAVDVRRRLAKKIASTPDNRYIFKPYIVESRGELFQVIRDADSWNPGPLDYKTQGFRVFRLVDLENGGWERITSLGDQALFLGSNNSISVSAERITGCEKNCIYFTDDNNEEFWNEKPGGGHDMGVYSLEDGSIMPHFSGVSLSPRSPPLWVAPFRWTK